MRNLWGYDRLLLTFLLTTAAPAQFSRPALMPSPAPVDAIDVVEGALPAVAPVLTVGEISAFVETVGWSETARHPARAFEFGMIEAIELERREQLRPGVELHPRAAMLVLSFAHGSEIPGVRPGSPQRYRAEAAENAFREFVDGVTDWSPVHFEAVRIAEQIMVLTTAGYLYASATAELADRVERIVNPASDPRPNRSSGTSSPSGAQSHLVREAQRLLGVMGFYGASFDGIWGPQSRAAMEAFQAVANLPVTGEPDSVSLSELRAEANLYSGSAKK